MAGGHREDDIGGLRPDAGKGHQFLPRALRGQRQDPLEAVAPLVEESSRNAANPRCLLRRKTRMPDRLRDLSFRCVGESLWGDRADARAEVVQAAAFVGDRRALGEDGRNQDLERSHPAAPVVHRVTGFEDPHRAGEGPAVHGL